MIVVNKGTNFDSRWFNGVFINQNGVIEAVTNLNDPKVLTGKHKAAWLLKALTCMDLTTLSGDDTRSNVARLSYKAFRPLPQTLVQSLGFDYTEDDCPIRTAAVCVYPSRVKDVADVLNRIGMKETIKIASVATGFSTGLTPLSTRLEEINYAIKMGADEIDVVIDRSLVLTGKWDILYAEINSMRKMCGDSIRMKVILGAGELDTLENVYKASMIAMMAGADFIKTSTGKESVNATLEFGIVMARAIKDYYRKTSYKIGLKPAGGIRTGTDALKWLILVWETLGTDWLTPNLFRIGASGLLQDIENELNRLITDETLNSIKT